ncbi:MAG: ABC transporter permease [Chloroflexi bacterium]|nr:ABC transporter permease [Chloroflexota bacterium]MCY3581140.1 ABC transporter permease [Chloroflexota bacterium]MXV92838.1 ABC transporter permease [Chloroflexota bacterium]MXX50055.1 ABC transporter permease [Chloroflexota bacterium]MYA93907.1 ABC transporter permease [Chloroflexota bacterium]
MPDGAKSGPPALEAEELEQRSLMRDALRRFRKNRLAMLGALVLFLLVFTAVFADMIAPYGLNEVDFSIVRLRPFVDPAHILGGDGVGRDFMTRLIYGARTSLLVGLLVPLISFAFAVPLGALAGYRGGGWDFFILRVIEIATAIPPLLFAMFLISITGAGLGNVIFVLAITSWIEPARISRAQFLQTRETEFVQAARALGASEFQIIARHILPNSLTPLLVSFTFAVPLAIFAEAGLSFLGIGITEPTASWGKMVGGSVKSSTVIVDYHLALFPTLLVALTMLSFTFVGDGLQEALDPARGD